MPVDDFQLAIMKTLSANRVPGSAVAGDPALHRNAWRPSNDVDVFNEPDADVTTTAARDVQVLADNGYEVDVTRRFEGFREAIVARSDQGMTTLQWVRYSGANFYGPVGDEDFGYRLSIVDLAVNKVIAAASRREPRDLVDLRLVARVVPMWNAICAAPGKDASLTPGGVLNMIRRNAQYTAAQIEDAAILPEGVDAATFARSVRSLLVGAEAGLADIPRGSEGFLLVDARGEPLALPPKAGQSWTRREAVQGPPWPSGPAVDNAIIAKVIRGFGQRGSRLRGVAGEAEEGTPDVGRR